MALFVAATKLRKYFGVCLRKIKIASFCFWWTKIEGEKWGKDYCCKSWFEHTRRSKSRSQTTVQLAGFSFAVAYVTKVLRYNNYFENLLKLGVEGIGEVEEIWVEEEFKTS